MSVTATKTRKQTKVNTPQKFVRLNLDAELERFLLKYEKQYKLLSRGDIIRMLLSEIDASNRSMKKFFSTLPKPQTSLSDNEQMVLINNILER